MDELYQRLTAYQTAMCLARNMLRQGIISEDDYRKIDTIIAKSTRYLRVVYSALNRRNRWIISLFRGNMHWTRR